MKKTNLTYDLLTVFENENNTDIYSEDEIRIIENAAYVACMNRSAHSEWTLKDLYHEFFRILAIDHMRIQKRRVHISNGNTKMGQIPSVSLLPGMTCAAGVPCLHDCYACKLARLRPNVRKTWEENTWFAMHNPDAFFAAVLGHEE